MSNISRQAKGTVIAGTHAGGQFAPHARAPARSPWAAPPAPEPEIMPSPEVVEHFDQFPKDLLPETAPDGLDPGEWASYLTSRKRRGDRLGETS